MNISIDFILNSVKGELLYGDKNNVIKGISTDSRIIRPDTLFLALKGENFDGHDYVQAAFAKGASAAIVSRQDKNLINHIHQGQSIILVGNTLDALQQLAASYRRQFDLPVVAVTGSVGKTTTKDIVAGCLSSRLNTLKTPGNFNNDIGLPLTVLELEPDHQAMVVEMAMRGQGEISRLASIARPTCAIISNVEPVHLETMGSLNNIAQAKCEVLKDLNENDFAIINGDNELLLDTARGYKCKLYTFGFAVDCDVRIMEVKSEDNGIRVDLKVFDLRDVLYFPVPAPKLAANVAASAGAAYLLGIGWEDIKKSLAEYTTSSNRLNIISLKEGGKVINDTYNANPVSMITALEVAKNLALHKRAVAILGDMLELGDYEVTGHLEVGKKAAQLGIDILVAIGERSRHIAQGALESGMKQNSVSHFINKKDSLEWLKANIYKTDVVLFKASRGVQLETLLEEWIA